ncbi:MAG: site-specific DNA-methyltransferase [Planctomycetota bacterium]
MIGVEDSVFREEDHTGLRWGVLVGDVLDRLADIPDESVHCVVTSPPYWGLRDYGVEGQIGHEPTPAEFVETMVRVFREVRRALRSDGTCWVNLGDSYAGVGKSGGGERGEMWRQEGRTVSGKRGGNWAPPPPGLKKGDLVGIPWSVAFALRDDGWYLRQDGIWNKTNPMPESSPTKSRLCKAHEYIFQFSKRSPGNYYFDRDAISEPATGQSPGNTTHRGADAYAAGDEHHRTKVGLADVEATERRYKRSVWTMSTEPYAGPHFAAFPSKLPLTCIQAATAQVGCCPHCGAGWERIVEKQRAPTRPGTNTNVHGRDSIEVGNRDPQRHVTRTVTVGWRPTCDCEHTRDDLEPAVVFDPFLGTGTTVRAAIDLGRVGFGIELNPDYAVEAVKRITKRADTKKVPGVADGQKDLFEEAV